MAKSNLVNTAELIRGRSYTYRIDKQTSQAFEAEIPVVIEDDDLLEALELDHDEVSDGDGEVSEKPRFRIKRGVPDPRIDEVALRARRRLSPDRVVRTSKVRRRKVG